MRAFVLLVKSLVCAVSIEPDQSVRMFSLRHPRPLDGESSTSSDASEVEAIQDSISDLPMATRGTQNEERDKEV